ncbi:hypothetical protein JCM11641_002523 [Rhodosporidiobolus odoratus]
MATIREQQRATMNAFIKDLRAFHIEHLVSLFSDSPDFKLHTRPASLHGHLNGFTKLGAEGLASKVQAPYILRAYQSGLVKSVNIADPIDVVQDEDKIVFHSYADGEAIDGQPYRNEYMFKMNFEPGTTKIIDMVEFMDSAYVNATAQRVGFGGSRKKLT